VLAAGDSTRHAAAIRGITDLFTEHADTLGEAQVAVFDEVILRLSRGIEFRVRVELAERLADIQNPPPDTVRDLALEEDIAIAGPLIQRSSGLREEDLLVLAESRGQDHLRALSRRATLSMRVTDILVRRGDSQVVRLVAENDGAQFSQSGFAQLLEKARIDVILQRMLQARCDLPAREMAILVEIAREKVRETFRAGRSGEADELIDTTIDSVAAKAARNMNSRVLVDDYGEASAKVAQRAWNAPIGEKDIIEMLDDDSVDEALVALASLAGIPVSMVARAFHASQYDPLLFIVRSARVGWETFRLLLIAKAGREPGEATLQSAFDAFDQLAVETAERIVQLSVAKGRALHSTAG